MSEQLLTILKLCLLVLLYLFFLRVLRAVWAEVRAPKKVEAAPRRAKRETRRATRKAAPIQLAVVEPAAQQGRTFPLGQEVTVGRAAGCQVTLDDTYASQIHARLFARDGQLFVEDLGSTNGTYLNEEILAGPQPLHAGDVVRIGDSEFTYVTS